MAIDGYSVRLQTSLLEGSSTALTSPDPGEQTGDISEVFGGFPMKLAASASDTNIKLGQLTDPIYLAVYGSTGVSFKTASGGTSLSASPFAILADDTGLGVSEIWVSNSDAQEASVTILAIE